MTDLALNVDDVRLAMGGDSSAFGRLIEESKSVVAAITFAVLRDRPASEDAAQDAFVNAWRALPAMRNPASFLPWLRQLARNTAKQSRRGLWRQRKRTEPNADAALQAVAQGDETGASEADLEIVRHLMDTLPDDAREVVTLFYYPKLAFIRRRRRQPMNRGQRVKNCTG